MIHLASQPMRHKDPIRALAAAVMLEALKDYSSVQKFTKDTTRNNAVEYDRRKARSFFFRYKNVHARPFNLKFCCDVLNLDPNAVREAIKKRRLDQEALESLTRATQP